MMHRNRSVDVHQFAMVPRADIPRASFNMQSAHKTTFDAGDLIPVFCEEVLPGDTWNTKMTAFARLATPIFPVMDNMYLDSFFFFVPNRLVWENWVRMMGERDDPADSISYLVPYIQCPPGGYAIGSVFDHFGLMTAGQVGGGYQVAHSALPLRAYNLIWNEWFRDQNLQNSLQVPKGDGPDAYTLYSVQKRGKRHDYFTSCLPWPQKGGQAVTIPLGTSASIRSTGGTIQLRDAGGTAFLPQAGAGAGSSLTRDNAGTAGDIKFGNTNEVVSGLYADLALATAATINQLRTSFQVQKLLERDARGGTRYTELLNAHFGVRSPDARLQRPEYLGGGSTPIILNPVAQTSATGLTGGTSPLGNLAAVGTSVANNHGFTQSFVEHGYIIGLVCVRADLTYQQGVRRHWFRETRYDYYMPVFANLGEQAVLNREIYCDGTANDQGVWGYQERWAEYRYSPAMITGKFRSTAAGTLDAWHLAQRLTAYPSLGATFIEERPPLDRILAVGSAANGAQLIFDSFFDMRVARPLPLYSVPGMIDHF